MPIAPEVLLTDPTASAFQRRQAVRDVVRDPPPDVLAYLTTAFADDDAYLRREIVQAVSRLGDASGLELLRTALNDPDDYVIRDAIDGMGSLGEANDIDRLQIFAETGSYSIASSARRAVEDLSQRFPQHLQARDADRADQAATNNENDNENGQAPPNESIDETSVGADSATEHHDSAPSGHAVDDILEHDKGGKAAVQSDDNVSQGGKHVSKQQPESLAAAALAGRFGHQAQPPSSSPSPTVSGDTTAQPPLADITEIAETNPAHDGGGSRIASQPLVSAKLPSVDQADVRSWPRSPRHDALCQDKLEPIQHAYAKRWAAEAALPIVQQQWLDLSSTLHWERSDKDDDIEQADESVTSATAALKAAKDRERFLSRELKRERDEQSSALSSFLNFFSSTRKESGEARIDELEQDRRKHASVTEAAEQALDKQQKNLDHLQQPIAELAATVEALAQQRETLEDAIDEADQHIQEALMTIVSTATDVDRRLQAVAELGSDGAYLRHCWSGLQTALARERQLADEEADLITQQQEFDEVGLAQTDELAETIVRGFAVHGDERQTSVRVNARVSFEEERGFFGYRNAAGSASGSGSTTVRYDVDTVRWVGEPDLAESVERYRRGWADVGECAANLAACTRLRRQAQADIREYIWLLQHELARDFEVGE